MSSLLVPPLSKLVRPGAPALHVMGEAIRIQLSGQDTGGAYAVVEDDTPPQAGPPLHVHTREDEAFFVLSGLYEFQIDGQTLTASAGTMLYAPRGVPHGFRNIHTANSRMLIFFSPAGFEHWFEEVDAASAAGPPSFETIVALAAKYGNHLA